MYDTGTARRISTIISNAASVSALAIAAALWLFPAPAHACSCDFPVDWGFIGPESGQLPANAAGAAWYAPERYGRPDPRADKDLAARFTVGVREEGVFRPLPARVSPVEGFSGIYVVAPEGEGLKPGATYRFTVDWIDRRNERAHKQVLVTIDGEELSAETALTLDMVPVATGYIGLAASGSCRTALRATQVGVGATLAQEAQQWREQLLYRMVVDGEEIWYAGRSLCAAIPPGRSWEAVGQGRVYAACKEKRDDGWSSYSLSAATGLESGQHRLTMRAFLPGTDIVLETAAQSVDLSCAPRSPDEAHFVYSGPDWAITVDRTCAVWSGGLARRGERFTWLGACVDGKASGVGRMTHSVGEDGEAVYESAMQASRMHGDGSYTLPDGNRYEGEWREGKICGRGTVAWTNGGAVNCEWRDDEPVDGTCIYH